MESVEFTANVGSDQIIRPPAGMQLPVGPVHVVVSPAAKEANADKLKPTRDWLLRVARESEGDSTDLPSDLAEQHDFYAHCKPKS